MIVADTGAVIALVDADDVHHRSLRKVFESDPDRWVLPWAVLPEIDYLLMNHVGSMAEEAFVYDLAKGNYRVAWGDDADLERAHEICRKHRDLRLGLVDATVMAVAERLKANAIATLDLRHFGAVGIQGRPKLLPRDLE
ncbi:MAG: type II toxin-antitoxin system VapC family toxin [Planctomycetota bacterium]|jgi:predicted nucleic acid-binding protein